MKQTALLCTGFVFLLSACSRPGLDPAVASLVDSLMSAQYKSNSPGAVILIAKDGVPILRKAYGLANLELSVPAAMDNVFAIASITKQFTAVAVLQLVQQGKLSLQDDIRQYLPEYNTHGRVITIEHLLAHTNGIPNISNRPEFYGKEGMIPTREDIFQAIENDSLLFEPGTDYSYNDFGYVLASYIVERVSGMPFHEYMRKNIFDPAGMKHTTFGARDRVIPMLATGYTPGQDTLMRPEEYYDWGWDVGMGDILTTADDMLRWDEALYTEKLVRRGLLEKAWTPYTLADGRKTNYGYGWWVSQWQGFPIIIHSGGIGGYRCIAVRLPAQHLYVVILSNSGRSRLNGLGTLVALKVAGKPVTTPPVRTLAPRELEQYTGLYQMPHYWILYKSDVTRGRLLRAISLHDTVLMMTQPGGWNTVLFNVGTDLFMTQGGDTYLQFHRDSGGRITSLEPYTLPVAYTPRIIEPRTALAVPDAKVRFALDQKSLQSYAGTYRLGGGHLAYVRTIGSRIFLDGVGELLPESETRFFAQGADISVEFQKDRQGKVTGLILNRAWTYSGTRIE